jgi:hypothetical protein
MLGSICFNTITVVRQENTTKNQTRVPNASNPSMTIGGQPKIATALSFLFDQKCSGTMTINGSLNGSSKNESVTISNNSVVQSMTRFDQITSIDFDSALTTLRPLLTIKYIDMGGSSVPMESSVIDGYPINLARKNASLAIETDGSVQYEIIKGYLPYTSQWSPKEFDLFKIKETSEQFIVIGKPVMQQVGINQHWICNLKRFKRAT